MRHQAIDNKLFIKNRKKIASVLAPASVALVFSNDEMPRNGDQTYPYRQNSDLFYLTGIEQPKTTLLLFPSNTNPRKREILFIQKTEKNDEIWNGHKLSAEEAARISGIECIEWTDTFESELAEMLGAASVLYLNSNENSRFATEVPYNDIRMREQLEKLYPRHRFERLAPIIEECRMIKEDEEIALIRQACAITRDAFLKVKKALKPGIMEYELEAVLTSGFIEKGGRHAFEPIVASGKNACTLHYITNHCRCNDGDLILFDMGAEYANYASDLSRTMPVNGSFSPRQQQVYDATVQVYQQAMRLFKPGVTLNQIQEQVCRLWEREHVKLGLYSLEELQNQHPSTPLYKNFFMHGVSHFMGLDVHDPGSKDVPLKPGMVVTCEPGIYIEKEGIGIRIETDLLITDEGCEDLLRDVPLL